MGMIGGLFALLFGGGRNVVKDTVEVFRENAEDAAEREAAWRAAALGQFASEFVVERKGFFDRFMDGLNRVPRPALAFGTIGLFVAALVDPVWFAARMQGLALVPEPLWWLMGAIVSFYFGARYQAKSQEFQASMAGSVRRAAAVTRNIGALRALAEGASDAPAAADADADVAIETSGDDNAALSEWRQSHAG